MSWSKIENYLFETYGLEGYYDDKLCRLMEKHDKEIQNNTIDQCIRTVDGTAIQTIEYHDVLSDRYDIIENLKRLKNL